MAAQQLEADIHSRVQGADAQLRDKQHALSQGTGGQGEGRGGGGERRRRMGDGRRERGGTREGGGRRRKGINTVGCNEQSDKQHALSRYCGQGEGGGRV